MLNDSRIGFRSGIFVFALPKKHCGIAGREQKTKFHCSSFVFSLMNFTLLNKRHTAQTLSRAQHSQPVVF
jgi:hypothetical protein